MNAHPLLFVVLSPLLASFAVGLVSVARLNPTRRDLLVRLLALVSSVAALVAGLWLWVQFDGATAALQYVERMRWVPSLGIELHLGVDGLSAPLVVLSTMVGFVATVASMPWWRRTEQKDDPAHPHFSQSRVPGYFFLLLLLQAGIAGTFTAVDGFLFFVCFELTLLPMYFLIGIWGGARREYAALKFILYTLAGSVLLLVGLIAIHWRSGDQELLQRLVTSGAGAHALRLLTPGPDGQLGYVLGDGTWVPRTFNLTTLAALGRGGLFGLGGSLVASESFGTVMWLLFFVAFAVKTPLVPLHTWLPDAHVEAPTPVSVILAGVLLKMGVYGLLRFDWSMLPVHTKQMVGLAALLGAINVVYAAFVCLAQKDLKRLVAYSSVSHMGFSLLGLASLTTTGLSGAVLNLVTHGVISAMLFLLVGVLYDRTHHREIDGFGGLAKVAPELTAITGLTFFASLGLPGLAGFMPEFLSLSGSFARWPWHVVASAAAMVITAAYYLWAFQRAFLGRLNERYARLPDLNWRERLTLYPFAGLLVAFGVYPQMMMTLFAVDVTRLLAALVAA